MYISKQYIVQTTNTVLGSGHELGQTPGDGEGQGSLACCIPWGSEASDMTR